MVRAILKVPIHLWTRAVSSYDRVEAFWNIPVALSYHRWRQRDVGLN